MAGLDSQVSVDAAPSTPTGISFSPSSGPSDQGFGDPSLIGIDAVAGPDDPSHLKELEIKLKHSDISGSYDDSTCSYGSTSSIEISSSTPSVDWLDELKKYEKDMPPHIRMGYLDVSILYHEHDRTQAEDYLQHLMSEIKVENGPIKAMLYDDPEMVAICGSLISHLAQAVQRSTYVFIYMTKTFVNDKWCKFQSESCLMEAITNPEKLWSVVPVFTEVKNKTFTVPVGLNALKGVNYYNNDKFYRKGVSRLIGDKISVRIQADEEHRTKQKVWLEEHKRMHLAQREKDRRTVACEEEKTRKAEERFQQETKRLIQTGELPPSMQHSASENDIPRYLPVLHHSPSVNSLKPVHPQNPAVYFQDMRHQEKNQGNLPNNSLLNCSHETDGGPSSPALRDSLIPMSWAPEKQENVGKLPFNDSDSEKDNKMSVCRKKKEKKVVKHVTTNTCQAQNVQIRDHNLANQKEIVTMSNSSDDDESVLTPGDVSPKEKATVKTKSSQMMKKVDISSGARSDAELEPQTVAGPCAVDAAPSTVADVRNMSFKPDIQPEHGTKNGETQHGTDIKGMTLPKHQVDIKVEEAEEVREEETNSGGEKCNNSSKVDVFQQSSNSVENSLKFEGSVNINSSEREKSTAKSLQKDSKLFSVPAKPIAITKPQVAHVAPIVQDDPNYIDLK